MKKYGFTLIELLAVIVVLAIIALIATPIVMNVISNASKGAAERSADNYIKAVETLIATKRLDGEPVEDGVYTIRADGNLKFGNVVLNGTKPSGGSIEIKDGQVVKNESSIQVGDYVVSYKDGKAEAKGLAKLDDVCQLTDGEKNEVGAEYNCNLGDGDRTFYVLEAGTSSKPVTLILEENYDVETLAWCDPDVEHSEEEGCNADGLTEKFNSIRGAWSKLDKKQIALPTYEQIYAVNDDESFKNVGWLYDNLEESSAPYGYWLSDSLNWDETWFVDYTGIMNFDSTSIANRYGVRPVVMLHI